MSLKKRSLAARLLRGKFLVGDGCWEWTAHRDPAGYGRINEGGRGKPLMAHRAVYELLVAPIPEGLQIDHLCRNRGCVNPRHLEPVTQAENKRRGEAGRIHRERMARLTHCKRGHEFTPENTGFNRQPNGRAYRRCRKCHASRELARKRKAAA